MKAVLGSAISLGLMLGLLADTATNAPARPEPLPPARIVIVHNPAATLTYAPQLNPLRSMVDRALTNLTGKATPSDAWRSLISTQDVIGLKVYAKPGPTSGTRPAVAEAVVASLLAAGVPARQVIVWDKHIADLRQSGFFSLAERYGVRVAGSAEAGYDETAYYESPLLGQPAWGDLEFGQSGPGIGRRSHVSKLISEMKKIITLPPLLNHNFAGISGHLYGLTIGSVDNTFRFESNPTLLGNAVPEILALDAFYDRSVLHITDALIGQYEGEERQLLHYSRTLNELWFSRDPVALDVLGFEELNRERPREGNSEPRSLPELYGNAALLQLGTSNTNQIDVVRLPPRRE